MGEIKVQDRANSKRYQPHPPFPRPPRRRRLFMPRTPPEMFRIKVVEPIKLHPPEVRKKLIDEDLKAFQAFGMSFSEV